jgi:hypothetical protein
MGPHTNPSTNAPRYPAPPAEARRFFKPLGISNSKAPNILAASARKSALMATMTHELESTEPKVAPVSAALRPNGTNMHTKPRTKLPDSAQASQRLLAFVAPKTLTVTATIG